MRIAPSFFFILLILASCNTVLSFIPKAQTRFRIVFGNSSQNGGNSENIEQSGETNKQVEFLEQASLNGADKIREMSIEERTKRAFLAEAAEDRINSLTLELENLLGNDGLPSKDEDRDEIVDIARQIKGFQEQYNQLVTGEASATLNMLNVDYDSHDTDTDFQ